MTYGAFLKPWKHKVLLGDIFHDDDLSLHNKAEIIAKRFRTQFPDNDDLEELLDELVDAAENDSISWFDVVWDHIYDWADEERVWVDTSERR